MTVNLPPELIQALKVKATAENIYPSDIIERAIRKDLNMQIGDVTWFYRKNSIVVECLTAKECEAAVAKGWTPIPMTDITEEDTVRLYAAQEAHEALAEPIGFNRTMGSF